MALLGLFSKRDKSRPPPDPASKSTSSSTSDSDQLSVQASVQASSVYSGPNGASSSKLILGFRGKKSHPPPGPHTDDNGFLRPPDLNSHSRPPRFSSSKSESGHDYLGPPPSRSDLFAAYAEPSSARSTRSLPTTTEHNLSHARTNSRDAISLNPQVSPSNTVVPVPPPKKHRGMFAWATRERKKSKVAPPDVVSPDDSFNLKSFRHVRPVSPGPGEVPRPPSSLSVAGMTPPSRPRGSSIASADSSQRISVAAFREAARRSAANSPSPSSTDLARGDVSPVVRPPSGLSQAASPQSGRRSMPRSPVSPTSDTTSSESEDEDDEAEDSAGSSTLRPKRATNAAASGTPRSVGKGTSNELGHRARPTPPRMTPSTSVQSSTSGQESMYNRARASQSTSALMPNAAARRASMLAAAKAVSQDVAGKKPAPKADTSDDSSSDSDDSDDAPLVRFVPPKRPGSAMSNSTSASRSRVPPKPLIDISGLAPPSLYQQASSNDEKAPTPPAKENLSGKERERNKENIKDIGKENERGNEEKELDKDKEKSSLSSTEKPTLNDRLARLAQTVAGGRSSTSHEFPAKDDDKAGRGRQPKRSQTAPVEQFAAFSDPAPAVLRLPPSPVTPQPPSPTRQKQNGRSLSTPNAMEGVKDLSDPAPIVPTPIRERSPPPAFSVTSRPASQLSLASHTLSPASLSGAAATVQSQTHWQALTQSQNTSTMQSPAPSMPSGRAPLIPDNGKPPSRGFTGGGLLASPSPNARSSPAPSSQTSSPAIRAARSRAATVGQKSLKPTMEETAAPVPVRPFALRNTSSGSGAGDASSRVSSSSVSTLSNTSSPAAAPGASRNSQPRLRASTVGPLGAPPVKPFAGPGFRGNSPASSTGESSSGRTPITPVDGSEVSYAPKDREQGKRRTDATAARRAHRKNASVTFNEPERERERGRDAREEQKEERAAASASAEESRRRERRRSEAKAALELGRIVNGHGPTVNDDDDEEDRPLNNMPPRMSMMSSMMGGLSPSPMAPMNPGMNSASPMQWQTQPGMLSPQQFMYPNMPPNADPAFLAAHQQAMMFAKQAFQMAVAQQAMAAAEEEWERGSTVAASMVGGSGGRGFGTPSMSPMYPNQAGFGMGMGGMGGMGMPMQGGWGGMMFPNSAQSMYAGSVAGSELGVNGRGVGWGSRSAYGDPSGNDRSSMAFRGSAYGFQPAPMPSRPESFGQAGQQIRPGPRPRTRTAPTGDAPAATSGANKRQPPPSSWKAGARPA